jgi:bidirectional [NiFe] hydrogenase diaphorase subunit
MITLTIDHQTITTQPGTTVLQACLDNNIFVPHLCHLEGRQPAPASCRLCFVSVQGEPQPVSGCTTTVKTGMIVNTTSQAARRLQRSALKLLLSTHDVDCGHCPANKRCQLQQLARHLKVPLKPKDLTLKLKKNALDGSHPCMDYYPNRCVLCGRCIYVCERKKGRANMAVANRGLKTVISFYGVPEQLKADCSACLACVAVCPVGALVPKPVRAEDPTSPSSKGVAGPSCRT